MPPGRGKLSTTESPVPDGLFGCVGPVGLPHQLNWALMVSVPRYWAPMKLPKMLFWWATLVEMVPGNWVALKRIPAPAREKPFPVKQFLVMLSPCAPDGKPVPPKLEVML